MITRSRPGTAVPKSLAFAGSALFLTVGSAQQGNPPLTAPTTEAPTVEVVGRTVSGAYHGDEASGAKADLPLRELPQSVRVITRQAIDDLGATKLDDVLDYVGGVSRQNNFGGLWDNVAIRGLPGNESTGMATLFNGFSSNRGFNAPRDLSGIDRIEFLKGTAAALYGSSEPGGTLNIISKRPLWRSANALEGYLGSYGFRRLALDSTGPLNDDFAYRLNLAIEDRDSFRDHVTASRQVIAPAFTWKLGGSGVLNYTGEYLRHATPLDRGVVAVNNALGAIPRSRFLGEPNDGRMTVNNQTHQFVLSNQWTETWRSQLALSYRSTSLNGFSTEATALQANGNLTRQRRFRDYDSDDIALQAEMMGKLRTGAIQHDVLFGFESFRFTQDTLMLRINPSAAAPYAINIFDPVYGQAQPTPVANTDTLERQRNNAFYVQNAITLSPQWRLVAGLRMDNYRQSLQNRRNNTTDSQSPSSTSPRIGLSWLPSSQWTLYGNLGQSFRPNTGSDAATQSFKPETGRALELGTKWESVDKRIGATAALFDIRKRNVLTADPVNPAFSVAAGEIRSRGLEFDLAGQLTRHWRINASMVLNEVEVTRDNTLETGGRLLNVPKVNGSLLAVYEDTLQNGQRYGVGGGFTHTGKRLGQARTQAEANSGAPAFDLPSYTTAKLLAYWRINSSLRLMIDADNIFNSTYYTSSFSRVWVTPGYARTITVGLQAKF